MEDSAILDSESKTSYDQEPLVSVVVPSFNHQNYILPCLDSIAGLSHKRLELIVSDDCSTDNTYNLAREWVRLHSARFEQSVVTRQPKNVGVVRNIQLLFDSAQGDYLALIASDDLFVASAMADRLKVFRENENLDAVFGNAQPISDSGALLKDPRFPPAVARKLSSPALMTVALLKYWHLGLAGPVLMLKRIAVLEDGSLGFLPDDLLWEDRYMYIRLAAKGKLKFIDVNVAQYRMLANSMSRAPGFYEKIAGGNVISDRHNRHLLHGIERLYFEVVIARNSVIAHKYAVMTYLESQFWRVMSLLLWKTLELRALISQVRPVS